MSLILLFSFIFSSCKKDDNTSGSINDPIPTTEVIFNPDLVYGSVTDIDGNVYKTIEIDSRVWMAENLKTTRYRNGDQIPNVNDDTEWYNLTKGAYCNYENDANNSKIYGRLYNYHAVIDNRKIAPNGWHIATDDEWLDLMEYVDGISIFNGSTVTLCETGSTHWQGSSQYVTNETGFTALPGGERMESWQTMEFRGKGGGGYWWSYSLGYSFSYIIGSSFERSLDDERNGYSVRCVKD